MDSTLPVIEVVTFRANKTCLDDPGLFKEVRDMVAASTSVKTMYWGRSVEQPRVFVWLLFWDSFTQSAARAETPSHVEMVRKLDALLDDPSRKQVFHVNFSQHPLLKCIEAPVTEFDIALVRETESIPIFDRISESAMSDLKAMQPEGFLAMAHGKALEDERTTVYTAGWTSIEEHMKLGMVEGHQKFVSDSEEAFPHLKDLQMHHVYFERHA